MACNLLVVSGMAFEARIAQAPGIRTVYGLEPAKLAMNIEQAIREGAAGLLSFGTAAGLDPSLTAGSIVIARQVRWGEMAWEADAAWTAQLGEELPDAIVADIAGVDRPLASRHEKFTLWADANVAAADMESQSVARLAQQHGLPFAVLRVVLDDAATTLPPAALAAARPDGSINYKGLIVSLLAEPRQLPALLRLSADHRAAKQALLRCGSVLAALYP